LRKIFSIFILLTFVSCKKDSKEFSDIRDAKGTYLTSILEEDKVDGVLIYSDSFDANIRIDPISESSFIFELGESLIYDTLIISEDETISADETKFTSLDPLSFSPYYNLRISYFPETNLISGNYCYCTLGSSHLYSWEFTHD